MSNTSRLIALTCAAFVAAHLVAVSGQAPGTAPTASAPILTDAEMEAFLSKARVGRARGVSKGITGTTRATLSEGALTHEASIQTVHERKQTFTSVRGTEFNFRDAWQFNVAAYRLDRLIGLHMVPVSIERSYNGREAAFTWWLDDVLMDEGQRLKKKAQPPDVRSWNQQMQLMRVFDELIANTDRNAGNILIRQGWRVALIDHTRAFRWSRELQAPATLKAIDRQVLAKLNALDRPTLEQAMERYIQGEEVTALLARRDLIVAHFEQLGDAALFDRP
jgi:hypothetical protein